MVNKYRLLHNEYVLTESSKAGNYPAAGGCQGLVVKETLKGIQDLIGPTDNADCTAMCGCVCVCVCVCACKQCQGFTTVKGRGAKVELSRGGGKSGIVKGRGQEWNCQGEGAKAELSRGGGKSGIIKGREAKVKTR